MTSSTGKKPPSTNVSVRINGKHYRKIEAFSRARLEHLLQLAKTQVTDYRRCYTDFDEQAKKKPVLLVHLEDLEQRVKTIEGVLNGLGTG